MESCILDTQQWAEAHFVECDFGDKRLTRRLVNYAAATAVRPNEMTPQQTRSWKDTKGAYRFMDNKKVSLDYSTALQAYARVRQIRRLVVSL